MWKQLWFKCPFTANLLCFINLALFEGKVFNHMKSRSYQASSALKLVSDTGNFGLMALQLCYCWMRLLQILFNTEEQIGNTRLKEKACPTVYIETVSKMEPKGWPFGYFIVGWSVCCKSHKCLSERIFHSCQFFSLPFQFWYS